MNSIYTKFVSSQLMKFHLLAHVMVYRLSASESAKRNFRQNFYILDI